MIKQRIMFTEIVEVKYIRYTRSHNSGNIHGENCIFDRSNKKNNFSKTKISFHIRTYWATNYESRSEMKFWVTCRCLSGAC